MVIVISDRVGCLSSCIMAGSSTKLCDDDAAATPSPEATAAADNDDDDDVDGFLSLQNINFWEPSGTCERVGLNPPPPALGA